MNKLVEIFERNLNINSDDDRFYGWHINRDLNVNDEILKTIEKEIEKEFDIDPYKVEFNIMDLYIGSILSAYSKAIIAKEKE